MLLHRHAYLCQLPLKSPRCPSHLHHFDVSARLVKSVDIEDSSCHKTCSSSHYSLQNYISLMDINKHVITIKFEVIGNRLKLQRVLPML